MGYIRIISHKTPHYICEDKSIFISNKLLDDLRLTDDGDCTFIDKCINPIQNVETLIIWIMERLDCRKMNLNDRNVKDVLNYVNLHSKSIDIVLKLKQSELFFNVEIDD